MQQLYIIKIGGNIIDDEKKLKKFLEAFSSLPFSCILVHGGGKLATEVSDRMGIETRMAEGRRITDAGTLRIVTMVYAGLINKGIVASLQSFNCNAVGLCGADAAILPAVKRSPVPVDYGFAGDILKNEINTGFLTMLISNGIVPVIAPLTADKQGQLLNTNADTIASALAVSLSGKFSTSLVYCFEKKGVLSDPSDEDSYIQEISMETFKRLKAEGMVSKGMVPKLDNAFAAINGGVKKVIICHADNIKEITEQSITGTVLIH